MSTKTINLERIVMLNRRKRVLGTLVAAVLLGVPLAACSSTASTRTGDSSPAAATPAAQVSAPATVPAGTTLRVGDQLDYLKNILHVAGQDQGFPYKVAYSAFIGGPPMLQAFQAGAVDAGFIGSTPLIFAQAGKQDIVAVAGWATPNGPYRLLSSPGGTSITGWADLKGKRVAYQQGTALEAALIQALDKVGLKLSDITTVNVPTTQVSSALQSKAADAGISVEPLTSVYLRSNPTAKVITKTDAITDRSSFFIASKKTLDDPARSAALADYVERLVKAFAYLKTHPDALAQVVYVKQYHLPLSRAQELVKETGAASFIALPGEVEAAQQKLADLFQANGEVPTKVDVSAEFDSRFNTLVEKAQGS
jgi:sulfonate transport system substrate-binding protein